MGMRSLTGDVQAETNQKRHDKEEVSTLSTRQPPEMEQKRSTEDKVDNIRPPKGGFLVGI